MGDTNGNGVVNPTDSQTAIIKQVEYYFGDVNLNRDKFMKEEIKKNEGWISISTLLTFNRLKTLSENVAEIVDALKLSTSGLIELTADGKMIKRSEEKPLPEMNDEYTKELNLRTIHIKGFPKDATFEDISEFCAAFGTIESVQMRRLKDKSFKGCIFAIYKSITDAEAANKSDTNYQLAHSLLKENKVEYFKRKTEWRNNKKSNKGVKKDGDEGDVKVKEGVDAGDVKSEQIKETVKELPAKIEFVEGLVIKLIGVPEKIRFGAIKDKFAELGKVDYVEIDEEKHESYVRLFSKEDVSKALSHFELKSDNGTSNTVEDKDIVKKEETIKKDESDEPETVKKDETDEPETVGETDQQTNVKKEEADEVAVKKEETDTEAADDGPVKVERVLMLDGRTVKVELVSGLEEQEYWKKVTIAKSTARQQNKPKHSGRGGFRGRKRGGGYQGRKRTGDGRSDYDRGSKRSRDD